MRKQLYKMDVNKVDMYLMANAKFFDGSQLFGIREYLLSLDEQKWGRVMACSFYDPTVVLIVSLLAGAFGVDRFMIGDTGLGILKLITCGGFGIWAIVDWFLIMGVAKQKNAETLQNAMRFY